MSFFERADSLAAGLDKASSRISRITVAIQVAALALALIGLTVALSNLNTPKVFQFSKWVLIAGAMLGWSYAKPRLRAWWATQQRAN